MRIMQVMAGAAHGGAETAFDEMCLALAAQSVDLCAVVRGNHPDRIKKLQEAGVTVYTLPFGGALDFYTPWKLKRLIRDFCPQIVQTWMSRAAKKTPMSPSPKTYLKCSRLGGYYDLKYYTTTDYFVTNTPDIKSYLETHGVVPERIHHINNFIEMKSGMAPIERHSLDTPRDAFVVLSLARYHPVKALDVLIRAAKKIENCHLWLAGQGALENELKNLARELGIDERVHFLGWRSDREALFQAADVCAVPSRYEPFGATFAQAWACRTPLVCSTAKGPLQYVRNGEDGLMFEIDDVDGLTEALLKIRDDPALGQRLAETGYKRYEQEFSKEKTVDAYLDFYREILMRETIPFG